MNPYLHAGLLLIASNILVFANMYGVYLFGQNSYMSWLLVYGPILGISAVQCRDQMSFTFTFSTWLAIAHGLAHCIFPFLDSALGVNKSVSVWEDQCLHLGQSILFAVIFRGEKSNFFKIGCLVFIAANFINVLAGYFCWGKECHNVYVAISLFPALASGLHFAAGALFRAPPRVATAGFAMQAFSSFSTYWLFKASDDILKTFALCRFFEIYFIAPHYVGYFVSRFNDSGLTLSWIKEGLELLGILPGKKGSSYESDPRKWGKAIRAMSSKGYLGLEGKAC